MINHFAVIPTLGERNDTLVPMVNQLLGEGVGVIIVENGGAVLPTDQFVNGGWIVLNHTWLSGEPVNLSRLWNMGLALAADVSAGQEYVVAVLNDDLVLPPASVTRMANAIMNHDVAAAFASTNPNDNAVRTADTPLTLGNRMVGYAFALRGSARLFADERFLWWWGDTDLDLQARKARGVVAVWLEGLQHKDPNGYTNRRPELYEQAGRDRENFRLKNGFLPW